MARKNLVDRLTLAEQELEAAKTKFVKLQKESADRIARLALKSGLPNLGLTDDQIKAEFDSIVAKHRKGGTS
ncbi:TraC family protein [Mesorhizobium sp. RMAD-H1]|uniref:TraC family protein n=1 Tax=Mesorhizobium sp. RMAD-H1 TaxID=2587065 RepID=UPI00161D1CF9|nr:TraC family protein [Mesorhizobium sp. RMAD-H1]MBB2969842.1 replicative DNA helicase [Mesorhizobium sp. RMAD-H1]